VNAMVAEAEARAGRLDVLVNVAGIPWGGPGEGERFNATLEAMMAEMAAGGPTRTRWDMLSHITDESFTRMLAVHLCGSFYTIRAAVPGMMRRESGSIVNFASGAAVSPMPGSPHYSAAKAGVLGLAKAMARELGPDGIRVNCVTPGLIQTDITGGKITDEMRREILKGIPLNRLGTAEDVAGVYLFLASDLSAYVTGAVIDVNGGMLIHG
jgi:NAD(P)-dependent dehydrogenase (short-subunit alcohol dehydrogenase family)